MSQDKQARAQEIELRLIQFSPTNPRKVFDQVELEGLAQSIKNHGVLQPVLVRPRYMLPATRSAADGPKVSPASYWAKPEAWPLMTFELVAGERRLRASELAGKATIPATIKDLSDKEVLEIQVIENEQRADLSPLEKARGYQLLIKEHGYTAEDLAGKIGKSVATIYGLLKMIEKLPKKALDAIREGDLSPTTAQLIARVPNERARKELTDLALRKNWQGHVPSYREIKDTIQRQFMIELKQAPFSQKDAALTSAGACTVCPKRTGNNRAEYPDGRADVCTDPECYQEKVKEFHARKLELIKQVGKPLLPEKEADQTFSPAGGLSYRSKYVALGESCHETVEDKTWGKVLGEAAKEHVIIGVDPKGQVHELVPKKIALQVLDKKVKAKEVRVFSHRAPGQDRAKLKHAKIRNETERRALAEIVKKAAAAANDGSLGGRREWLEILAWAGGDQVWSEIRKRVCKARGFERKGYVDERLMKKVVNSLESPGDVFGFLVELLLARDFAGGGHFDPVARRKEICQTFDVDFKAIEEQVKREQKEKDQGKKKPAAAAQPSANGHANGKAKAPKAPPARKAKTPDEELVELGILEKTNAQVTEEMLAQASEPRCIVCGCTENCACPGGCHWVDGEDMEDRCSRCVGKSPSPTSINLRSMDLARRLMSSITRLEREGLVTAQDCIDRHIDLGLSLEDTVATIPGVGKAAGELAKAIEALVRSSTQKPQEVLS